MEIILGCIAIFFLIMLSLITLALLFSIFTFLKPILIPFAIVSGVLAIIKKPCD